MSSKLGITHKSPPLQSEMNIISIRSFVQNSDNNFQGGGFFAGGGEKKQGSANDGERRKMRMFVPVTVNMIQSSEPTPDDIFEFDGIML